MERGVGKSGGRGRKRRGRVGERGAKEVRSEEGKKRG